MNSNTLYYGDCLDWMGQWSDQSVDLIYLDPPFNSNADYNMLYSSEAGGAQYRAFNDTWYWDERAAERYAIFESAPGRRAHGAMMGLGQILGHSGMLAYLTYMAERLEQMQRLLRPTGSIYLHCDPTASHGLKLVMDAIFGHQNFRNEITWQRTESHNTADRYGNIADIILYYSGGTNPTWNGGFHVYGDGARFSPEQLQRYRHKDPDGRRYRLENLTAPRPNSNSGKFEWRGTLPGPTRGWGYRLEQLEAWWTEGRIRTKRDGTPRLDGLKAYLDESPGKRLQNVWTDVPRIPNTSAERLGYPTQKPLALLERIILASSNPGDVVLDPFCGCGTAIEAAHKLKRQWVGIDISSFAIDLIRTERMKGMKIPTKGIPQDVESARKMATEQPFAFESWAVTRLPGFAPNTKQVADGGVDGRAMLAEKPENFASRLALAQVKGGKFSLSGLRDFIGVTHRDKAALGCFVSLEPVTTRAARAAAAELGKIRVAGRDFNRLSLWPVSDYFDGRLPVLPMMTDPYTGRPIAPSLFR